MNTAKKTLMAAGAGTFVLGLALVGLGQTQGDNPEDFPEFNKKPGISVAETPPANTGVGPGEVEVNGDEVKNLREKRSDVVADFCRNSPLKPGEGEKNKGDTCVSYPIGEVAKNPVRVAIPDAPSVVDAGKSFTVSVKVEDKFGPLDLNAFTADASGKAGNTFLEHPGQLDKDGRPFAHAHLGVTTLSEKNGLPGESYDAAFSGVQGVKGDLTATVGELKPGFYRADVYVSQPGHLALPTAVATNVQAFASFSFQVK